MSLNLWPSLPEGTKPMADQKAMTPSGSYGVINQLVDWIAGTDNSWWASNAACTKAAGGTSIGPLYESCMAGQRQVVADTVALDPSGAQAYADITSGNPIDILNPFSGALKSGDIPGWVWLGLGMVGIWIMGEYKK